MEKLGEDILTGAKAIGAEIGIGERRAFYLLEQKIIPGFRLGKRWHARKSKLREHILDLEREASA